MLLFATEATTTTVTESVSGTGIDWSSGDIIALTALFVTLVVAIGTLVANFVMQGRRLEHDRSENAARLSHDRVENARQDGADAFAATFDAARDLEPPTINRYRTEATSGFQNIDVYRDYFVLAHDKVRAGSVELLRMGVLGWNNEVISGGIETETNLVALAKSHFATATTPNPSFDSAMAQYQKQYSELMQAVNRYAVELRK